VSIGPQAATINFTGLSAEQKVSYASVTVAELLAFFNHYLTVGGESDWTTLPLDVKESWVVPEGSSERADILDRAGPEWRSFINSLVDPVALGKMFAAMYVKSEPSDDLPKPSSAAQVKSEPRDLPSGSADKDSMNSDIYSRG
jgi:hypothetical protein